MDRGELVLNLAAFQILFIVIGALAIVVALVFRFEFMIRLLTGIFGVVLIVVSAIGLKNVKKVKYG